MIRPPRPLRFVRRVLAWMRKEVRDQLPILLGLVVALPVLIALAIGAFERHLATAPPDKLELVLAGVTLVLVWFGLAGDLVAGEVGRGSIAFVRRQPGGMAAAWTAKVLVLGLAAVGLVAYAQAALGMLWTWMADGALARRSAASYVERLLAGRNEGLAWSWRVLPVLSWVLLVGAWLGRSGAASLGALLLLAAVGGPALLWVHEQPWFFGWQPAEAIANLALALGATGLLVATFSWLWGHRVLRRPWMPALGGCAALLVASAGLAGWAFADYRSWSEVGVDDDLRIATAFLGADSASLWVTVHKGVPYADGKPVNWLSSEGDTRNDGRGTPIRTWRVDLRAKHIEALADGAETWPLLPFRCALGDVYGPQRPLCPVPFLVLLQAHEAQERVTRWYDTGSARPVATLPSTARDGSVDALLQRGLRDLAFHRDADGRRVWIRDGVLEREGAERAPAGRAYAVDVQASPNWAPVPGGWAGVAPEPEADGRRPQGVLTPDGRFTPQARRDFLYWGRFLSPETHVETRLQRGQRATSLLVRRLDTDEVVVERPARPGHAFLGVRDELLVPRADGTRLALVLWNPIEDTERAVTWLGAAPASSGETPHLQTVGRRPEGACVVEVIWPAAGAGAASQRGVLVVDPAAATARQVLDHAPPVDAYMALEPDGALVVIEDHRRVVRHGPALGQREVLFPFPSGGATWTKVGE